MVFALAALLDMRAGKRELIAAIDPDCVSIRAGSVGNQQQLENLNLVAGTCLT